MKRVTGATAGALALAAVFSSCERKEAATAGPASGGAGIAPSQPVQNSGAVPGSFHTPEQLASMRAFEEQHAKDEKIRQAILTQIKAENHLLFRGDSAFYKWKGNTAEGFVEAKGYYIDLRPQQVTEADRLNGATYVAKFYLTAPATRSYRRYMWGSDWRSEDWTRWAAPDPGLKVSRIWSMAEGTYEQGSQEATVKVSDWASWGPAPKREEIERSNPPK